MDVASSSMKRFEELYSPKRQMLEFAHATMSQIDMASITLEIPDKHMQKLEELASLYGLSPETLLLINLENWLDVADSEFVEASKHVLHKNSELYRRLA